MPLIVTLGVFILWLGWFGFNGGSQLALGTAADVVAMSNVITNTVIAGAAGFLAAIAIAKPVLGRVDLLAGLNGAIAGLVSVTAGPNFINHYWAILIGAIGGMLCILASRLPVLIIRVYNSGLEGVLGSGGFDAEAIHGGVSSG